MPLRRRQNLPDHAAMPQNIGTIRDVAQRVRNQFFKSQGNATTPST